MEKLLIYHGSPQVVNMPDINISKPFNDFGKGFYCSEDKSAAGEWACLRGRSGFINTFEIDPFELNICDLSDEKFTILNWLAVVLSNRLFRVATPNISRFLEYLQKKFLPDLTDVDIIKGCACDDEMFITVRKFIDGQISYDVLKAAVQSDFSRQQIVPVSEKAISSMVFTGCEKADASKYYPFRMTRGEHLKEFVEEKSGILEGGLSMYDILIEEVVLDDSRL